MNNRQQMYGRYNRGYRQDQRSRCSQSQRPPTVTPPPDCRKDDVQDKCVNKAIDKCVNDLPLAMAYVPMQRWENVCDAESGLALGSIFKDLIKPYCPVLQKRSGR